MKKLDIYIIKKFLGTFFFTIALLIVIVIVFDISEKIDDFLYSNAPISQIAFVYYPTFIPYFTNLFSPLFTFIAVVYFTSRMAYNTEIIAILSSGVSFKRLLRPYLYSALVVGILSFYLANFLIPKTNEIRIDFENRYLKKNNFGNKYNIHIQNKKGEFVYLESFTKEENIGYNFTFEKVVDNKLQMKIVAPSVKYDSTSGKWTIFDYTIRTIAKNQHFFKYGKKMDTTLNVLPHNFYKEIQPLEVLNFSQLNRLIEMEKIKGSEKIKFYEVEKHKRIAFPFATIILTFIGVSLSSRKLRGGIGLQLALGLIISFGFIVLLQVSTVFATNGTLIPWLAVWIPNILVGAIAIYLSIKAPK